MCRFQISIDPGHYVDSGSDVNSSVDYRVIVSAPGSNGAPAIDLHEDTWYRESNGSLPQTVCFADIGCSAGISTKQQLYLSKPVQNIANGRIPVFSVKQLSNNSYVGTLGVLGSTKAGDTTSIQIEKSAFNPTHTINFNVLASNWSSGGGTNLQLISQADLTSANAVLHYAGTASSTRELETFSVTPQIWRQESTGDVLVYSGTPTICSDAYTCSVSGDFVPVWDIDNVTGTFVANIKTSYTLATVDAAALGLSTKTYAVINDISTDAPVEKAVITEPLAPQKPGTPENSDGYTIPWNSTIEHAAKDGKPITVVFGPDGQPISRMDDDDAAKIAVPGNRELPATEVYLVPSEAVVNQSSQQNIAVIDPTSLDPVMTVKSDASTGGSPLSSSSSGVYYPDKGATATTTVGDNVFMAPAVQHGIADSSGSDSSYKYMKRYFEEGQGMNILCDGEGDSFKCTGLSTIGNSNSAQTASDNAGNLNFSIMPGAGNSNGASNLPLDLHADAIASLNGAIITYTFTATSSQKLPQINITPMVFTSAMENRSLSYRAPDKICFNTDRCTVSGEYTVTATGDYFAHGYINFTAPDSFANTGSPKNLYLLPDSDMIPFEQTSTSGGVGSSVAIKQIDNKDIYLWGLASKNQDRVNTGGDSPVNVVIYNKNRYVFLEDFKKKSGGVWHHGSASAGNGYSGQSSSSMSWKTVAWGDNDHLEKGAFLNTKSEGGRYHCPLFAGGYSSSLRNDWTFADCHHEYWVWGTPQDAYLDSTHIVYSQWNDKSRGYNDGRLEFYNDLVAYSLINSGHIDVNFSDADDDYHDGMTWVLTGK
jgi:hypothetical protein